MVRRLTGIGLTTSALFLSAVAIMLNSPNLFYMGTALFCTIVACRLQAWLSVRGLRFERQAAEIASAGELLTVEITVWSEHRIRRPLISIVDDLPPRLLHTDRSLSLPVAPAYDQAIRTAYSFRPVKRGVFRWSGLTVIGTDALGLVRMDRQYKTTIAELVVLPTPVPVSVELPTAAGWGISEAESGQSRGAGLEPRGVREYRHGDSLRHVHWRSSARAGKLLVKDFEAGSHASVAFLIQRQAGTEIGEGSDTSLELMCGHTAYLAEQLLRMGTRVDLPLLFSRRDERSDSLQQIYEALATADANARQGLGEDLDQIVNSLTPGCIVFILIAVADPGLPDAISRLAGRIKVCPLVYDALEFGSLGFTGQTAISSEYMDRLRLAGATPIIMPGPGRVSA